jgi:hypothetical protein
VKEKEQFDCCAKQAELAFNSFNARRQSQWKITLGLWALMLLATKFVLAEYHGSRQLHAGLGLAALVVVLHAGFVSGVWVKNHYDEQTYYYFRNRGSEIAVGHIPDAKALPTKFRFYQSWRFITDGSSLFQVSTTVILSVLCVIALHANQTSGTSVLFPKLGFMR